MIAAPEDLPAALAEGFTPDDLDRKVADPLDVPAHERSDARDVIERARTLVDWATRANRVGDLLRTALRGNPSSARLRRLNEATGLVPATSALAEIMRPVLPRDGEAAWLRGLVEVQRQVCRIRVRAPDTVIEGVGFLVGPDQIMAPASVVGGILGGGELRGDVEVAFDDASVHIASASPIVVAIPEHLYVLRLDRAVGREAALEYAKVAVRARGWVAPAPDAARDGGALAVVQFGPDGPVVAVDPAGLVASDGQMLRYRTTTHLGSSGAPCFDERWRFAGIHVGATPGGGNFGRAAAAIVADLHVRGYRWDVSTGVTQLTTSSKGPAEGAHDALVYGIASRLDAIDDIWSPEVENLDLPIDDRWAWVEAAAVHASFDPETLAPLGTRDPALDRARVALLLESKRSSDGRWTLPEKLRRWALERLVARNQLVAARAANPTATTDPVDVALGELIGGRPPTIADRHDPEALRAVLVAVGWLEGIVSPLPDREQLAVALERATLIAPFHHLTRGFFAGRDNELRRLGDYAAGGGGLPLFICGPGGMGKSALLSRFVLALANRDPLDATTWRPFVYLDFDQPELDATNLTGILLTIARQLASQRPELRDDVQALVERTRTDRPRGRRPAKASPLLRPRSADTDRDRVAKAVARLVMASSTPVVLILDTLEEVQFTAPDAIEPLVELITGLRKDAPNLRPIFAGRVAIDDGVEPMELGPLSREATEALLTNDLPPELAKNTDLVGKLIGIVGSNPLSLKLAATLLRREAANATHAIDELGDDLQRRVGDAIVQGRLYERILGHIHDPRVRALAYPGLVLRRITWRLIRDVLAEPCRLGAVGETEARALFAKLSEEVALVRSGQGDALELRPELRRIVREDLANDPSTATQQRQIHVAAVAFYAAGTTLAELAEELYHRLSLDEDPDEVDKRWRDGVGPLLRDAVTELPLRAAAFLANRVDGVVGEGEIRAASQLDWEAWARKRSEVLIQFGQPAKVLALLAARPTRLPTTRLHIVESTARRMLPSPDLVAAEAAAERGVAAARASANSDDLREALEELLQVRRLRDDAAGVVRALADLGNLGDLLGDDLVLLQSNVEALESFAPALAREQFSAAAVRVFARLPDELVAKAPELARRVAAQIGGSDPATLKRVIGVVGTGALREREAESLMDVLRLWANAQPEISTFMPKPGATPNEIASAAYYLVTTRVLDRDTAANLAVWLAPIVTPHRSVLDEFPFPLHKPAGRLLCHTLADMFPIPVEAHVLAQQHHVDPASLPLDGSPRQLWAAILTAAAAKGTTRALVTAIRDDNPASPHAAFLGTQVDNEAAPLAAESAYETSPLPEDDVLAFNDDLTLSLEDVPDLIATLQRMLEIAPAVCLLEIGSGDATYLGTGFRISTELVMTAHFVLFPQGERASRVVAKFGFDSMKAPPVVRMADVDSIYGDADARWAIVRVPDLGPGPCVDLAQASTPRPGDGAFILQHPGGGTKRLGFVRNPITDITDEFVEYLTDTRPGSSGAPVFDAAGRLVALHFSGGEPSRVEGKVPVRKNRGVRATRILERARSRGIIR